MTTNNDNGNGTKMINSPKRIAEILDVKEAFVNRELREGKIKGFKVGKSWRITWKDFEDYCSSRINNGNGKRGVKEETKDKIRFLANLRRMGALPDAVEGMTETINEIKETLPGLDTFQKLAQIARMKKLVLTKVEKQARLENKDAHLEALAEKAYPGMKDLLGMQPDELEAHFLRQEQAAEVAQAHLAAGDNA